MPRTSLIVPTDGRTTTMGGYPERRRPHLRLGLLVLALKCVILGAAGAALTAA